MPGMRVRADLESESTDDRSCPVVRGYTEGRIDEAIT